METEKIAISAMQKARARLLLDFPFYGALALRLDLIPANKVGRFNIETAATNGKAIYYNSDYINSLSHNNIVFLLAHELGHILFKHHTRRAGRDPQAWNMAGDHVINLLLSTEKIGAMIKGALYDIQFDNMSSETVYKILQDQSQDSQDSQTDTDTISDPCGGVIDAPEDIEPAALESELKESLNSALNYAKKAGNMPGITIQNLVKNLIAPRTNWKQLLQNWLSCNDKTDFSFSRPARRETGNYIMPGLYNENIGKLIIAIDTSASVVNYTGAVESFQSEINSLRRNFQTEVELLYFHGEVYKIENFNKYQDIKINITETGGTRIQPVFDHVNSSGGNISGLIVFSDMEVFDFPKAAPGYPVLFLQYGGIGYKTTMGKTIKINNN